MALEPSKANSDEVLPKKPIAINVQVTLKIPGDVTVKVSADGKPICELTKEIDQVQSEDQEATAEVTESEGLRRRVGVPVGEKSSESVLSEHTALPEESSSFHFPTFDEAKHSAQEFAQKVWDYVHYGHLPDWMKDNEFLHSRHRPPTPSIWECIKSIFGIHTETVNIWTHMMGCVLFTILAVYYLIRPGNEVPWEDKLVSTPFFVGVIACLGLSSSFHTLACHSEQVGKFFNKLDYAGIVLLIVGSFPPWLHYGFYCHRDLKNIYLATITALGLVALIIVLWDKLSGPKFRVLRTVVFCALGLFGIVPFVHVILVNGYHATTNWLVIMGALYIFGAVMYASRVPERFFPGKCDILWQSHQFLHLCVVAAAVSHYHGITQMANTRWTGSWPCGSL